MLPANPYGNQNYTLSHRRLSSNSSGINTGASQPNQMTRNADDISFSTTAVGFMRLHVGKIITALSEYEKLLLSSVLAPDTEKKPCSAQPDNNGIYCWMVDLSQHRSSHLLHDAPDQVMVTSALDFSLSCIYRIMISDLSSQHSQLHCDASFDWTQNHHPEVSFNVVLPHPGQFSLQQLMCLKQEMIERAAMRPAGLQYPDNAVQHKLPDSFLLNVGLAENINNTEFQSASQNQQTGLVGHQFFVADEPVNGVAETPSSHNVSPAINSLHIAQQVAGESESDQTEKVPNEDGDGDVTLNSNIANRLPWASDAEIIDHIGKFSGRSIKAILTSIRAKGLITSRERVSKLVDDWREEHPEDVVAYRRKKAHPHQIMQHIEKIAAGKNLNVSKVIKSLRQDDLGTTHESVVSVLKDYREQRDKHQQSGGVDNQFFVANKSSWAFDAKITEHINKLNGISTRAVLNSIHEEGLSVSRHRVKELLVKWRMEHPEIQGLYRREGAGPDKIWEHILKIARTQRPGVANVMRSLHHENLGSSHRNVSPLIKKYREQQKSRINSSK